MGLVYNGASGRAATIYEPSHETIVKAAIAMSDAIRYRFININFSDRIYIKDFNKYANNQLTCKPN
jgi:hypothetical protein